MKQKESGIPEAVVRRLPKYYKLLTVLESEGIKKVSSGTISERLNLTASQVRQDLSHFGAFGLQGYGYNVSTLRDEIKGILGLTKDYSIVIVGAGHIGQALANYRGFAKNGMKVVAVFDIKTDGISVPDGVEILHVSCFEEYVSNHNVDICVISTREGPAEEIADMAKRCKIPAIWNFAHKEILPNSETAVENINLSDSIFTLTYMMNCLKNKTKDEGEEHGA